jgi:hypothetical protein
MDPFLKVRQEIEQERADLTTSARKLTTKMKEHQDSIHSLAVQRDEIVRLLHWSGMSMRAIGRELGITGVRVHEILTPKRKTEDDDPNP